MFHLWRCRTGVWYPKIHYAFRGHKTHIEAEGDHCPACGEVIMDREQSNAYQARVKAFKAQIIAVTIEPAFIMSVRKNWLSPRKRPAKFSGRGECVLTL